MEFIDIFAQKFKSMEYIGKRISIKRSDKETSIVIVSQSEKTKNILLFAWFFIWTVSGIVVLTQYFLIPDPNTKVMLIVWLGFWAYFEFRIFKAFMWRKFGVEKIKLKENKFFYKRDVAGKGKIKVYECDFIKDIRIVDLKENSFADNMNKSYWMVGGEKLAFDYYGKEIKFAMQIEESEAKALLKVIRSEIK
ncbi:MAG: hypothetical protein K0S44_1369 [Bacteroidetes bacterium]|jgi:hypothetical protein|nr:hypothetical protein [Bacteroidota bacterium]